VVAASTIALTMLASAPVSAVTVTSPISGAGSTWAQNAVDQWRKDVNVLGIRVNYAGTGSSDGRNQFRNGTVDFAFSDIPYGLASGGVVDPPPDRQFAYVPMVAGGLALAYNLSVGGSRVTSLRLTNDDIAGIFTGTITWWDDAGIAAHNPGLAMPHTAITPVVRGDGSGDSYYFSDYVKHAAPAAWSSLCVAAALGADCPATSIWPTSPGAAFVQQAGSLGVSGYVSLPTSDGAITYVANSFAVNAGLPRAKVLNHGGFYVGPTSANVSLALLDGQMTADGFPDVASILADTDPRIYPLSMMSAMIAPTALEGTFDASKGLALSGFGAYALCQGQRVAAGVGGAALPKNYAELGLTRLLGVPGADPSLTIGACPNPTMVAGADILKATVPQPPACDADAHIQCGTPLLYSAISAVTLTAPRTDLVAGQSLTLKARLTATPFSAPAALPVADGSVVFERRRKGTTAWVRIGGVRTNTSGAATVSLRPDSTSYYRVRFPAAGGLSGATAALTATVRFAVAARASASVARTRSSVTFSGAVGPRARGKLVVLQELRGRSWVAIATGRLGATSRYSLRWVARGAGRHYFRVVAPADLTHGLGASSPVSVRVR
jgi:ABC-type phosphate transport system substrate-binding protein